MPSFPLDPIDAHIDACAPLIGHWNGHYDDQPVDENWLPARGGEMMGSFRWEREGKVWLYEFIQVAEVDGKIEMRLRHFNPDFSAWEEKDQPTMFDLVEATSQLLVFRQRKEDIRVWLIYRWPETGHMQVSFKREDKPHSVTSVFEFRKA